MFSVRLLICNVGCSPSGRFSPKIYCLSKKEAGRVAIVSQPLESYETHDVSQYHIRSQSSRDYAILSILQSTGQSRKLMP